MDRPVQEHMNIYEEKGRALFFPWFFGMAATLDLRPLIAGRWRSWVKQQNHFKVAQLKWLDLSEKKQAPKSTSKESKPWGVNLYGFAYGELGIGEDLRMAVACCEEAKIPYHVVNIDAGDIRQADDFLKGKTKELHDDEMPPYRINIFCLPAFDTVSRVFMQKGASVFEGYHNIGWWPWELNVFPKAWTPYAFELIDEIWASSKFLHECYSKATDKPVHHVPLAVSVDRISRHPRKYYGLPDKKFLFLYIFDFNSSLERKNPMAAIEAFKMAFPETDKSVGLVLKTMNSKPDDKKWQEFTAQCQSDKRITVINKTLDRPDVLGLIDACDAYVSLHRSEGFGRTIAEALLLNKPVIATNYSGNVDFMNQESSHLVDAELIGIKAGEYQWSDVEDKQEWANISPVAVADHLAKVRKIKAVKCSFNFSPKYVSEILNGVLQQ
jgi:glycosyltransferase involved in cell wall biosynthesis